MPFFGSPPCRDSQGFCCGCPFFNLGGNAGITRANLDCGLFNVKKSAHCLRWDDNWWFIVSCPRCALCPTCTSLSRLQQRRALPLAVTQPAQQAAQLCVACASCQRNMGLAPGRAAFPSGNLRHRWLQGSMRSGWHELLDSVGQMPACISAPSPWLCPQAFAIGEYLMDFRVNLDITSRSTNATTNVTTTSKQVRAWPRRALAGARPAARCCVPMRGV